MQNGHSRAGTGAEDQTIEWQAILPVGTPTELPAWGGRTAEGFSRQAGGDHRHFRASVMALIHVALPSRFSHPK
jgi:hypothetical protein